MICLLLTSDTMCHAIFASLITSHLINRMRGAHVGFPTLCQQSAKAEEFRLEDLFESML